MEIKIKLDGKWINAQFYGQGNGFSMWNIRDKNNYLEVKGADMVANKDDEIFTSEIFEYMKSKGIKEDEVVDNIDMVIRKLIE